MRRFVALAVVATFLCVAAPARAAESGDMDPTFNNGAPKVFDMGAPWELVEAVHVLRSGRLLVAGTYGKGSPHDGLVLARLLPGGAVDQTFGSSGRVTVATGGFLWGDSTVQPDGKILVGGTELIADQYRAVVRRFTTSGALDRQFGVLGSVVLAPVDTDWGGVAGLAVTSSGAIVVGTENGTSVRVTRLTPSGAIDRSFGSNGVAESAPPEGALNMLLERVALTASGTIVLGTAVNTSCGDRECTWNGGVAQLLPDGAPDRGFAGGGYAVIPDTGFDLSEDLAAGPGGTVYVAGGSNLFRLASDGSPDQTFGSAGSVPLVRAGDIDLTAEGRVVVAGGGQVSRFLPDGSPDLSFGGGDGVATYGLASGATTIDGGMDVQPDGRIVVGGTKQPAAGTSRDGVLFRLLG